MRRLGLCIAAMLLSQMAFAVEEQISGKYWKALCDQPQYDYACAYFITGLIEGLTVAVTDRSLVARAEANRVYGYCPPTTASVGQMKDVFKKYLNDHPESRQYTGASLALESWRKAWPCK